MTFCLVFPWNFIITLIGPWNLIGCFVLLSHSHWLRKRCDLERKMVRFVNKSRHWEPIRLQGKPVISKWIYSNTDVNDGLISSNRNNRIESVKTIAKVSLEFVLQTSKPVIFKIFCNAPISLAANIPPSKWPYIYLFWLTVASAVMRLLFLDFVVLLSLNNTVHESYDIYTNPK